MESFPPPLPLFKEILYHQFLKKVHFYFKILQCVQLASLFIFCFFFLFNFLRVDSFYNLFSLICLEVDFELRACLVLFFFTMESESE